MRINRWVLVGLLFVAACVGAGAIIASVSIYHYSDSSDAFCTQCHTMAQEADKPYYQNSRHRNNHLGVQATCDKCHVPMTNWFVNTFTRVTLGMKDSFVELTHDFSNPAAWEAYRVDLEPRALARLRAQDSVTCRSCHDADAIHPTSEAGRASHASLGQGGVTCVDCHTNLVHPPAAPVGGRPIPSSR
jgi:trimethylamine-N-oxide reductase (cytochrome c), cytochrome c-type subunit TorY